MRCHSTSGLNEALAFPSSYQHLIGLSLKEFLSLTQEEAAEVR